MTAGPEHPVDAVLPDLARALREDGTAVLIAPPGAGKTTRVPLFLDEQGISNGRILMFEPRRLAVRTAAHFMASLRAEQVGKSVGYRMRGESKSNNAVRIEIVTEGLLLRMIQQDPELSDVGCLIFDEFHERSLHADLGLALALELRSALRPDLKLLVMSATLDAESVADLLGTANIIRSEGRSWPVEEHFLNRPWRQPGQGLRGFETAMAETILQALEEQSGNLLAFLPGEGEIRRVEKLLKPRLPEIVALQPLFGRLPLAVQKQAIAPPATGRKIVLATSIAETSLTIEGITVVVDGGLARRALFDTGAAMTRLITERVTKAEATQRQGRAGRLGPGQCYKLWTAGENGGLLPFPAPDILQSDLSSMMLQLALWGCRDPAQLSFLDQPRQTDVDAARRLLVDLGALTPDGMITDAGTSMAALPLPPRLARMLISSNTGSALAAALLSGRDIFAPGGPPDVNLVDRWRCLNDRQGNPRIDPDRLRTVQKESALLKDGSGPTRTFPEMAALAYPDRIGRLRDQGGIRYLLSNGKGVRLPDGDPLTGEPYLVVTDLAGQTRESLIRLAVPLPAASFTTLFEQQFVSQKRCEWDGSQGKVIAEDQLLFGALLIKSRPWKGCPLERIQSALMDGIRQTGMAALPFSTRQNLWRDRVEWLRNRGVNLPAVNDFALIEELENWLLPSLGQARSLAEIAKLDLGSILRLRLDWQQQKIVEELAPASFSAPTGTSVSIDYKDEQPRISIRLQEMFGLKTHPTIGPDHVPLLVELLSPAQRPVQATTDLPGFWASSYHDVRKDLRGRYPKHFWPEDAANAAPTNRTKKRM